DDHRPAVRRPLRRGTRALQQPGLRLRGPAPARRRRRHGRARGRRRRLLRRGGPPGAAGRRGARARRRPRRARPRAHDRPRRAAGATAIWTVVAWSGTRAVRGSPRMPEAPARCRVSATPGGLLTTPRTRPISHHIDAAAWHSTPLTSCRLATSTTSKTIHTAR